MPATDEAAETAPAAAAPAPGGEDARQPAPASSPAGGAPAAESEPSAAPEEEEDQEDGKGAPPAAASPPQKGKDRPERLDRKQRGTPGETALHAASRSGHASIVVVLLDAGAEINSTDANGATPLMVAASGGHLDCVRELLGRGASLVRSDVHGHSLLHYGFEGRSTEVQILLRDSGVRPCASGRCMKCRLGARLLLKNEEKLKETEAARLKAGGGSAGGGAGGAGARGAGGGGAGGGAGLDAGPSAVDDVFEEEFGNLSLEEELAKMKQDLLALEAHGGMSAGGMQLLGGAAGGGLEPAAPEKLLSPTEAGNAAALEAKAAAEAANLAPEEVEAAARKAKARAKAKAKKKAQKARKKAARS